MDAMRVLIADDHALMRRGLRDLLERRSGWQVVGEACDGAQAVEQAVHLKPDVAILDFSMPAMTGPEALAQIVAKLPETAVLVLTMHDSDEIIHDVLRCGARGLVLKSDAEQTLLEALEAVAEGRHYFDPRAAAMMISGYRQGSSVMRGSRPLTAREEEVLRLLAHGRTSKEVAQALGISTRTAESHRININRKLAFHSVADLVRYAIRNGMVTCSYGSHSNPGMHPAGL